MSSRRRPPNSRTPARTRAPSAPRSALIAAQIVFVFMLFGLLQGLEASMRLAIRQSHAERMFVSSRLGSTDLLPVSLWRRQLQKVPGVARVAFESQLPCTYRGSRQYAWALGVDPASYFAVYYENRTTAAHLAAFEHTRAGALVGADMAHRFGWKVGQHVTLQCFVPRASGTPDWEFDIVGEFQDMERPDFSDLLLINYDIGWLARSISIAAFAALVVAVGALAMQSIRERRGELAVLKVVGFTGMQVQLLVLMESAVLWVSSALVGLCAAALVLPRAQSLVGQSVVPLAVVGAGLLCALALSAVSAFVPAWQASQLQLVDALAEQ